MAIGQLPVTTKADDPEMGADVLVRADSAGATHGFVDAIMANSLEFSIGFDITEAVRLAVLAVPERGLADTDDPGPGGPGRSGSGRDHLGAGPLGVGGRRAGYLPARRTACRRPVQPVRTLPAGVDQVFITNSQLILNRLPRGPPPWSRPGRGPHQNGQGPRACAFPRPRLRGQRGVAAGGSAWPRT